MTGSKDFVVDVHLGSSMATNVEWGDASYSKVLGLVMGLEPLVGYPKWKV